MSVAPERYILRHIDDANIAISSKYPHGASAVAYADVSNRVIELEAPIRYYAMRWHRLQKVSERTEAPFASGSYV